MSLEPLEAALARIQRPSVLSKVEMWKCRVLEQSGLMPDMKRQSIGLVSVVVGDYDEALAFYVDVLGFTLIEDTYIPEQDKRWVVVAPPGSIESRILLARASTPEQQTRMGNQTGGRVFLFLYTDDFWRDYESLIAKGVVFVREPQEHFYGIVAVFSDLYGNQWDLLQPAAGHS